MHIRYCRLGNARALYRLEKAAWGKNAAGEREIRRRLRASPSSYLGAFRGRQLLGSVCLVEVKLSKTRMRRWVDYLPLFERPDEQADCLYMVSISAYPKWSQCAGLHLLRRLFTEAHARRFAYLAGGFRIPGYRPFIGRLMAKEYVRCVCAHKILDPVLSLGLLSGFRVRRILPGYYPDAESADYGVLAVANCRRRER